MSSATLERILDAMRDSNGVPARERTVASVLGALDSSEAGKHEVVDFIIEDFALTQKVLALANSPMYASFGTRASSVTTAIKVLGANALMHIVLGAQMVSEEELQADGNLSKALFASELARNACAERAEDASIATLMYEIGRLMTGKYLADEAAKITKQVASGADSKAVESAVLGVTYQELGVELAARWNLPDVILSVIDGTGDPTLVGIAAFSSSASSLIHEGRLDEANELLRHLDLPALEKQGLSRLISRKTEEIAQWSNPNQSASAEQQLRDLLSDLKQRPELDFDGLVKTMMPAIAQALQAAHCLLLMMTRSGSFRVHSGDGKDIAVLKEKFRISAEFRPTPFHAAIKKNIDVSIADVGILKAISLPEGYRDLLPDVKRFVLLPIANGQVRAMVYCDWNSDGRMTKGEVKAVIALRNLLLPFMSH
jgi:HD-like signal output (HDOD) protein